MKMFSSLLAWVSDIVIWGLVAIVTMMLLNAIVGMGISYYWFGTWTDGISQLWPEIMYPAGILLGLLLIADHRPDSNQY